jgi:hypothetical protein
MARRRIDIGLVVALAWLFAAAGLTALVGPALGLRGWVWLLLHHLVCAVGCGHELWRAWRRRRVAVGSAAPPGSGTDCGPKGGSDA